jgi:hypothetical protein
MKDFSIRSARIDYAEAIADVFSTRAESGLEALRTAGGI